MTDDELAAIRKRLEGVSGTADDWYAIELLKDAVVVLIDEVVRLKAAIGKREERGQDTGRDGQAGTGGRG